MSKLNTDFSLEQFLKESELAQDYTARLDEVLSRIREYQGQSVQYEGLMQVLADLETWLVDVFDEGNKQRLETENERLFGGLFLNREDVTIADLLGRRMHDQYTAWLGTVFWGENSEDELKNDPIIPSDFNVEIDSNGIGKIIVDGEAVEVVASCKDAVFYYGVGKSTLHKILKTLKPIPGYEAKAGTRSVSVYRKAEVDELFSFVELDSNGIGRIIEDGEVIEVIGSGNAAALYYDVDRATLYRRLKTLKPIPGYEAKAGTRSVSVYRKAEVDELFPKVKRVELDSNGIGKIIEDGEELEVIVSCNAAAFYYGVGRVTLRNRLKTLNPVSDYEAKAGTQSVSVYKKAEVDELFPKVKRVELDSNGIGKIIEDGEELEVIGSCNAAAFYYGVGRVTLYRRLKTLKPISGYKVKTGTHSVSVYKKAEVDELFPKAKRVELDSNGIGKIIENGEELEVIVSCKVAAAYYGVDRLTLRKRLKTLNSVSGYEAKVGTQSVSVYKKAEVDELF